MDDKHGLKAAADRGIALGEIGNTLLFENEYIRLWEVRLSHSLPSLSGRLSGRRRQRNRDDLRKKDFDKRVGWLVRFYK